MVKLNISCDVLSILSKHAELACLPGISIKPDMSKEERKIESILLLKEGNRFSLVLTASVYDLEECHCL